MTTSDVPSVSATAVPAEGATLLDVREDDEWAAGHAPTAVHIPMAQVPERLGELNTDNEVYVVCRSGGRSARVTAWLVQNGVDALNVEGGMKAFHAAGHEIVSDSGTPEVV